MKIGRVIQVPVVLVLLVAATVALVLIIALISSSPRSASEHYKLLSSTIGLIVMVQSSPVFVFFLCNVMIVAIILGSSRPSSVGELDWILLSSSFVVQEVREKVEEVEELMEELDGDYEGDDTDDEDDDDEDDHCSWDDDSDSDISEDDEGGEDLNRRIEEFIEKINGIWREEFLREKLHGLKAVFE